MKELHGIPININRLIIGRISHIPLSRLKRKDSILVYDDFQKKLVGYEAILLRKNLDTSINSLDLKVPMCCNIEDLDGLNDGDIISIKPNGTINVLYEINSPHNAILATEQCNFSCIMCPQDIVKEKDDKTFFNLKLISLMDKQTRNLAITGGEPTLIGDNLFSLLEACKKYLPDTPITLLTNGMKFEDFDYAKKLASVYHKDLIIAIPLYADTDREHNSIVRAKSFHKIIQGIYNCALLNLKIEIRTVIIAMNYKRLRMFAEFIYHNFPFVIHIALMGLETRGLARENIEKLWIDPYDYIRELTEAVTYLDQRGMCVSIYNHQLCVLPEKLWPFAKQSISSWKNIFLNECSHCDLRNRCCGFFSTAEDFHSSHIRPIKNNENCA